MTTNEIDIMKQFELPEEFKDHFTIKSNVIFKKEDKYFSFDVVIYRDAQIFAVVEIKHHIHTDESIENAKIQIQRAVEMLNCPYGIITDDKEFYVIKKGDSQIDKYASNNELIEVLTRSLHQNKFTHEVSAEIRGLLTKYDQAEFITKVTHNSSKYTFSEKDEDDFILKLIHNKKSEPAYYYRYMTFESAFNTLHENTYRMNSIVGMNDKSEVDYFNKKVYKISKNQDTTNDIFISSFSSLGDDLTMWRLYGDDGKGVCLAFELKSTSKRFMLNKVCYKKKPLNLLSRLVEQGWMFRNAEEWKHLFKSQEYSVEREYRLLFRKKNDNLQFIKKEDWFVRKDTNIISKFITFDLNAAEFPLRLHKVIVGPKCTEQKLNVEQLRNITKQYNDDVIFSTSKIKTYR